jgi:DNA-binding response OmpR family regulator
MSQKPRILIVDDDESLAAEIAEQLGLYESYQAETAHTADTGLAAARGGRFALVLLDVNLGAMDGREVCKMMRRDGVTAPIILMTGEATSDADQILGLEAGANDYVEKPFKMTVLLARIRAHLRSHETSEDAIFTIGPYEFRPAAKTLMDARQKRIRLTEKETNILKYLYRAGRKPVAREELLKEVWGYNPTVTTHTLETHIYRLRQKIEPDPQRATLLLTEQGGYRLDP